MNVPLRQVVVAGVGGMLLGHILWLIGVSVARSSPSGGTAVLVVLVLFLLASAGFGYLTWQRYVRQDWVWAAFFAGLPVSPVIFTLIVLGVTYL